MVDWGKKKKEKGVVRMNKIEGRWDKGTERKEKLAGTREVETDKCV